jgi:hypothetical protein
LRLHKMLHYVSAVSDRQKLLAWRSSLGPNLVSTTNAINPSCQIHDLQSTEWLFDIFFLQDDCMLSMQLNFEV